MSSRIYFAIAGTFIAVQALVLLAMGQPPICLCGTIRLWNGVVSGPEGSQQIADWYTFTHVLHGFGFYFLLWLVAPGLSFGARLAVTVGIEAGWEIVENTPFVISRYRQSALAHGYFGDSVINSVFDTLAATSGFLIAWRLPMWGTFGLAVALELLLGLAIHDNLTLNIIQLVHPIATISLWQAGG